MSLPHVPDPQGHLPSRRLHTTTQSLLAHLPPRLPLPPAPDMSELIELSSLGQSEARRRMLDGPTMRM